ncbi:MAG: osmoprotectant transport system permease protein [Solirubrobacteraceae bacterium]|jgi:osmoprotectant transport system permease protein|nr:osmoprotectant transport system permease protein [Solirubrobacteraceae bacterium]
MHEFVDAFKFIAHNGAVSGQPNLPSLVHLTLETLKVGAIGIAISLAIAVPLGVWLGHIHRGSFLAINLGNVGRALPSLVVLAVGDAFLGLGLTVVELALVILAVPPIITNAYLGIESVDPDLVDAARGMGMTEREVLLRVELPLAVPPLFAGIRTAGVFVISTTTIASLAGFSGSLGDIIANETSYHFSGVLGAAICVALLALAVEGVLTLVQHALTPRGLRTAAELRTPGTIAEAVVAT